MNAPRLYLVVPVLNEAGNMPRLVAGLRRLTEELSDRYQVQMLLVDDGSTDGTADTAVAEAKGVDLRVLSHPVNRGPGKAFATAFTHLAAVLCAADWVVTMEGDNTSRVELLSQMLLRAEHEGFDVILASPYLYGGGIANTSAYRTILSHAANLFIKEALGLHGIVTMSSFFRLYRGDVLRKLQDLYGPGILERAGFESMIELLLKLTYCAATISEIAMRLDTSQRVGKSKMRVLRTIRGYLTLWRDKGRWRVCARSSNAPQQSRAEVVHRD